MIIAIVAILLFIVLAREVYAATHIQAGFYIKPICTTDGHGVLLTFDDGPNVKNTPKVLEVLRRYNAKAVFFCIGGEAEKYPDIVKQIISEGHMIGQHTYCHNPFHSFFSSNRYLSELQQAHDVFARLGVDIKLFRPPLGITNVMIKRAVEQMGYLTMAWSVRSFDTRSESRAKVISRVVDKMQSDSIILLHDRMDDADIVAEEIIKEITNRGWTLCNPHNINL